MILTTVHIKHFRNFKDKSFTIHPFVTIIIGENAHGKTNLLEAIYCSIHGVGFREWREEELIQWEHEQASVETLWQEKDDKYIFYILLMKKDVGTEKKFSVNKAKKS